MCDKFFVEVYSRHHKKDPLMHEHICSADKQTAKKLMYPFKNEYIHLANFKYHPNIIRKLKVRKGLVLFFPA